VQPRAIAKRLTVEQVREHQAALDGADVSLRNTHRISDRALRESSRSSRRRCPKSFPASVVCILNLSREGKSVDAVIARELLDFVSTQAEWVGLEVPGFAAALARPGRADE